MKIITGYGEAREVKDVIEFFIKSNGKTYRFREYNDCKIRFSATEGRLMIEPVASNLIEIDQSAYWCDKEIEMIIPIQDQIEQR